MEENENNLWFRKNTYISEKGEVVSKIWNYERKFIGL
jgi:hypothetical protein